MRSQSQVARVTAPSWISEGRVRRNEGMLRWEYKSCIVVHPHSYPLPWVSPEGMFAYDNSWLPSLGWLWCPLLYLAYKSSNKGKSISLCILIMEKADSMGPGWDGVRHSQWVNSFVGGKTVEEPSCSQMEPFLLCPHSFSEEWLLEMDLSWLRSFWWD